MSYPRSGPGGWTTEGERFREDAAEMARLRSEVRRLRAALRWALLGFLPDETRSRICAALAPRRRKGR